MNKLIDAVRTFLSGVEYIEQEENANYVVTKEDKELLKEAIDTVIEEFCEHHWLPVGEWDGVMMLQCTKCNLFKGSDGKRECVHPYAAVYGGCGKPERCLLCGEILSD